MKCGQQLTGNFLKNGFEEGWDRKTVAFPAGATATSQTIHFAHCSTTFTLTPGRMALVQNAARHF